MPQAPAPEAVADCLVGDLLRLEQPVILVLDDYHVIRSAEVHRAVQMVLDRRPPALRLVIATRADPPLTIARWRARGEVTEIRAAELRFTTEEAGDFLRRTMQLAVPDEAVAALGARTEGWAAGLQLAGLSLRGRDAESARSFVASFSGSHRYVIDYLADEVLREQSPDLRDFLCSTAVLDRLSAPLCDAVTGRSDSRSLLAALEQANLFLVPLDDQREWYRYHHLFRDVLRAELPRAEQAELHGRAAAWYESQGNLEDAIRHADFSSDRALLIRLVKRGAAAMTDRGNIRAVLRWLQLVPPEQLRSDPELGVYQLWALFTAGQFAEAMAWLTQLDAVSDQLSLVLRGRVACVRAWLAGFAGSPDLARLADEALRLVPPSDIGCRSATVLLQGNVLSSLGDVAREEACMREAYALARSGGFTFIAMTSLMDLAIVLDHLGRRQEALALCEEALQAYADRDGNPLPVTGPVLIQLGSLHYFGNQLDAAERYARQGMEYCRQTGFEVHVVGDGERVLAGVAAARGDLDEAVTAARKARDAADRAHLPTR
jgi:LuxR family maltose regulon positive regulatory protein